MGNSVWEDPVAALWHQLQGQAPLSVSQALAGGPHSTTQGPKNL